MIKHLILMLFGFLATSSFAHDTNNQDQKNIAWLSQMAGLHAQKACGRRSGNEQRLCEVEQIKSLAETAASIPGLRPANTSPDKFAAMIENHGRASPRQVWQAHATRDEGTVDCRINVC